jgi:hypothetical protein
MAVALIRPKRPQLCWQPSSSDRIQLHKDAPSSSSIHSTQSPFVRDSGPQTLACGCLRPKWRPRWCWCAYWRQRLRQRPQSGQVVGGIEIGLGLLRLLAREGGTRIRVVRPLVFPCSIGGSRICGRRVGILSIGTVEIGQEDDYSYMSTSVDSLGVYRPYQIEHETVLARQPRQYAKAPLEGVDVEAGATAGLISGFWHRPQVV